MIDVRFFSVVTKAERDVSSSSRSAGTVSSKRSHQIARIFDSRPTNMGNITVYNHFEESFMDIVNQTMFLICISSILCEFLNTVRAS